MSFEPCEKVSDAFEKLCEKVFACGNILGRLYDLDGENDFDEEIDRILAETKTPMPAKITLAGENTCIVYQRLSLH